MVRGLATKAHPVLVVLCALAWAALDCGRASGQTQDRGSADAPARVFQLPGLTVNLDERYVDLDATVCLDQGFLELIACTKGSKEHESIVAVDARPQHVHAALLLLGASSGHPTMQRQIGEENPRWIHLPAKGDPIVVSLVIRNREGEHIVHPISDFVMHIDDADSQPTRAIPAGGDEGEPADENDPTQLPKAFIFAGSLVINGEDGSREYLADRSGHVISVVTFGDEVLCLPGMHTADNAGLVWQLNPQLLPAVGTQVKLRLTRPAQLPAALTNSPQPEP
jgi:hypothetical protein